MWRMSPSFAQGLTLALCICSHFGVLSAGNQLSMKLVETSLGEKIRISCSDANGGEAIEWWKGGGRVTSNGHTSVRRNGRMLKIVSLISTDLGLYICKDEITGRHLDSTLVSIKGNNDTAMQVPVFLDPLKMKRAKYNVRPAYDEVRFPCAAISPGSTITYTWYKNGNLFNKRRLDQKLVFNASTLRLKKLYPSDVGNYTCVASNRFGDIRYGFKLIVLEKLRAKPVLQKEKPDNVTAFIGSNVSLSCYELISGTLPDFRWVHWRVFPTEELLKKTIESETIANESVATLMDPSFHVPVNKKSNSDTRYGVKLQLHNVTQRDSGWYSCIVSNHIGTDYMVATLRVVPKPGPTTFDKLLQERAGQSLKLLIIIIAVVIGIAGIGVFVVMWKLHSRRIEEKANQMRKQEKCLEQSMAYERDSFEMSRKYSRGQSSFRSANGSASPFVRGMSIRSTCEHARSNSMQSHFAPPADLYEKFHMHYDEEWEIERESLQLGEVLGEGAFGIVVKAEAFGLKQMPPNSIVAVKMLRGNATENDCDDLLSELKTMKSIGKHMNIINFLGCSTQSRDLLVVVEYAPHGNLRQFLRSKRPTPEMLAVDHTEPLLSLSDLISAALQISKGMQYLVLQKCIHRDLAARNVLVGDDYVMKIADFGLARSVHEADYYKKKTDGRLPVKWLAIEALFDRVYTAQSDVWAFGILLWEIFTLGGSPYPGVPVEKLFDLLKKQFRMENPQGCPPEIYDIMCKCWFEDPASRPTFDDLVQELQTLLEQLASLDYLKVIAQSLSTIAESDGSDCGSRHGYAGDVDCMSEDDADDVVDDHLHHLLRGTPATGLVTNGIRTDESSHCVVAAEDAAAELIESVC